MGRKRVMGSPWQNVRNKQTNEKMSECDKCYEGDTCYEG